MQKEQITDKEAISVLMLFILGSSLILGIGGGAKQDSWLAGLLGIVFAVPILWVYARIIAAFPGKDLYEILELTVGKYVSKVVTLFYIWYAFFLGSLVLRNFGEFINTVALPETPMIMPMLFLAFVCIYAVVSGIEVIARISAYVLPLLLFIIIIIQLLALHEYNLDYIKPILGNGWMPVVKGGFPVFTFPFAETVLFLSVFYTLKNSKTVQKVYYWGLFLAGAIIILITLRNIFILGGLAGRLYFPSHIAVSRISIGAFIQRIELSVAVIFVFGAFIKSSICLFAACKGIAKVLNLAEYRSIVIQTGLLMLYLGYFVFDNIMLMKYWATNVYPYYAVPFQVILPLFIFGIVLIKKLKKGSV